MKSPGIDPQNLTEFLDFLRSKFTVIHNSNIFFRDLQFGAMEFLRARGLRTGYSDAERIATAVAEQLERKGIFRRIDHQSWRVDYPDFALPRVEKTRAATQ